MDISYMKMVCFLIIASSLSACQLPSLNPGRIGYIENPASVHRENFSFLIEERMVEIFNQNISGVVAIRSLKDGRTVLGSGFILDQKGHVVTNAHVLIDGGRVEVTFHSGLQVVGDVVGVDEISDLAILRVEVAPEELQPLNLNISRMPTVGQIVLAIGNPLGMKGTMSFGIISGVGRLFGLYGKVTEEQAVSQSILIQIDSSINQGNSGGPLIGLNGDVEGITSALLTSGYNRNVSGVGFAISSDIIERISPSLIEQGRFEYPYLGISSVGDLSLEEKSALGLPRLNGVYIAEVVPDSPAEKAGLKMGKENSRIPGVPRGGDLIVKVDNYEVADFVALMSYIIRNKMPGDPAVLTILRENELIEMEVVFGLHP